MGLRCSRFSCSAEAVASMQFDADASAAIIIDLGPRTAGMPLCAQHAETRTAPMGWTLSDRRTGADHTLWQSDEKSSQPAVAERPAKRRTEEPAAAEAPAEEKVEAKKKPGFTFKDKLTDEDTPDELTPDSPLLSRAFRGANG